MKRYTAQIEMPDSRLGEILNELDAARETIYRCYQELMGLDVLVLKEEPPKSDGSSEDSQHA